MRLGVTLGDPAGIGPEVTEAALRTGLAETPSLRAVLCGPTGWVEPMAERLGSRVLALAQPRFAGPVGRPSAESGRAALQAIAAAVQLAKRGEVDALLTAPISKQALAMSGSAERGHTELLARELGRGPVAMAFFAESLRVVLASGHIPMRQMLAELSSRRVVEVACLLATALREACAIAAPRLALAGLNPHASEGGLFGNEEALLLLPAVAQALTEGVLLSEPQPADSVFRRAREGEFDGVVALYHDQGLIPVKLLDVGGSVNVTLGLSVPRTSPDHGTAFDRVGTGTARPDGMLAALRLAAQLARPRALNAG